MRNQHRKRTALFIFLIFPYIKPQLFDNYTITTYLYYGLKAFATFIILYEFFRRYRLKDVNVCVWLVVIFRAISLLPTINNPYGDLVKYIGISIFDISFVLTIQWCCKVDRKLFLKVTISILEFWVILNAIGLFIPYLHTVAIDFYGTKSYGGLLGIDNRFIYYYIPMIFLRLVYNNLYSRKLSLKDYVLYFLCFGTLLYTRSAAAMFAMALFIPAYIYLESNKKFRIFNYHIVLIAFAVLNIVIVYFRAFDFLSYLVVNLLQKDLTFSYRTFIWDKTLQAIAQKPILGYGYETVEGVMMHCNYANHPHNYMLTLMLRGGYIGCGIYCFMLIKQNRYLKTLNHDKNYKAYVFTMMISLMLCLFDSFDYVFFYLVLFAPTLIISEASSSSKRRELRKRFASTL